MDIRMRLLNWWPPFLLSGIKIIKKSPDFRQATVRLKLHFWNCNYFGTQYGGLLYSMTDPLYVLMLIHNLGSQYSIWNKASLIRFVKPGRTDVFAEFLLVEEDLEQIRQTLKDNEKMEWIRTVNILDKEGNKVAEIEQTISIKVKKTK